MKMQYEPGDTFRMRNPQALTGKIDRQENYTQLDPRYHVTLETGYQMMLSYKDFLPLDDPWHEQMKKWREEGIALGRTSIVVAIDEVERKYKAFFVNTPEEYSKVRDDNPLLTMKYYWTLAKE